MLYCKCAFPNDLAVDSVAISLSDLKKKFFPGLVVIDRWLLVFPKQLNLEKKKEAYSSWSVKQLFPGLVLIDR